MADKVKQEGNSPPKDSILTLQGESNYASWLQSLIHHIGPENWKILMEDEPRYDLFPYATFASLTAEAHNVHAPDYKFSALESSTAPISSQIYLLEDTRCQQREKAFSALWATLNDEAKDLIRNVSSPSKAFKKLRLFYSKPIHQTTAARWSKWTSFTIHRRPSSVRIRAPFLAKYLQEVEEISDKLDQKAVFAQFVSAISGTDDHLSPIANFLNEMHVDLKNPALMPQVCHAFVQHAMKVPAAVAPPVTRRLPYWGKPKNFFRKSEYCPFHKRMVKHSPSECFLGQRVAGQVQRSAALTNDTGNDLPSRKRPRVEAHESIRHPSHMKYSGRRC
ncbi:hypothetical protein POX_d06078 [Penicillium oxalicum]|uniref:hypothetical protein n=1 Tax=Penicillium oxalicum TaxID=69781 RepID=UPI0020B66B57|nr:hypothetical protein POX_d06078 [Penicillium oxalicum]KAI2790558.1 hypothetical protein POX_d06078 [Penicillium oxalicum]